MSHNTFSEYNHRLGLSDECPHCNHRAKEQMWMLFYYDKQNVGEVNYRGEAKTRVASTCPECGNHSWAHFGDTALEVMKELLK